MDSVDSVDSEHARNPEYTGWNSGYTDTYPDTYPDSKYAKYARSPWYTW